MGNKYSEALEQLKAIGDSTSRIVEGRKETEKEKAKRKRRQRLLAEAGLGDESRNKRRFVPKDEE